MGSVDHIEIADGVLVVFQHVLPAAASPGLLFHVKFQHPQVTFSIAVFKLFAIPQRALKQRVQLAAVRRCRHALKTLGTRHLEVLFAIRCTR
ncbi:hypothetical protein D3C71_1763860 [compost metagenome]